MRVMPTSTPAASPLTADALVRAGAIVGTLDILKPIVASVIGGRPPLRVFQAVASGALGRSAYDGGWATILLGAGFHYFIAFSVVAFYALVSRRFTTLARHPLISGPIYGLGVYCFMQFVVFPLSAIGPVPHPVGTLVDGILTHIFLVGLPTAWLFRSRRAHTRA
jgi:uncharacterized membrane protein YagU involved in acid resistance